MSFLVQVHWRYFGPKHLILAGQIPQESKNRDIGGILAIFGKKSPPPAEICLPSAALWPLNAYWPGLVIEMGFDQKKSKIKKNEV